MIEQLDEMLDPKMAYSVNEAGGMIGVSRRTIYELLSAGTLRSVRIGRRRLIRHDDLADFIDGLEDAV